MQAISAATKASFKALGSRLRGGAAGAEGSGIPFFEAAVELVVPSVGLNPSMATIQAAINASAEQVGGGMRGSQRLARAAAASPRPRPIAIPGPCQTELTLIGKALIELVITLQVLDSLKVLSVWGGAPDSLATYHDLLVADASITQALLYLLHTP